MNQRGGIKGGDYSIWPLYHLTSAQNKCETSPTCNSEYNKAFLKKCKQICAKLSIICYQEWSAAVVVGLLIIMQSFTADCSYYCQLDVEDCSTSPRTRCDVILNFPPVLCIWHLVHTRVHVHLAVRSYVEQLSTSIIPCSGTRFMMAHEVSISGETNAGNRNEETIDTSHF